MRRRLFPGSVGRIWKTLMVGELREGAALLRGGWSGGLVENATSVGRPEEGLPRATTVIHGKDDLDLSCVVR